MEFLRSFLYFCVQKCRCERFLLCGKPLPAYIAQIKIHTQFSSFMVHVNIHPTILRSYVHTCIIDACILGADSDRWFDSYNHDLSSVNDTSWDIII